MSSGSLAHGRLSRYGDGRRSSAARTPARAGVLGLSVAALMLLAAVLRFYGLGHQGFWFDEANTALLVRFSPTKMLGLIPQTESTPPLYYCLAWVWSRVVGDGQAGLRSLSAVAGVLVVPVAYGAAGKLISRRAGLICAALTACNPFLIWYSQEARSYELLVLLTGLALLAFAYVRSDPSPPLVTLWVIASALALATHYFAALAIAPQAVWLAVVHRRRRAVQAGVAVITLCGLALIPLALSQNGTGHDSWIGRAPLAPRLAQIIPQFLIGTNAPIRQTLKLAAIVCAVVALVLLAGRARAAERHGALVAAGLCIAGFAIALALIVAGFDDLITRNIIELWLPGAAVIAGGLAAARAPRLGLCIAAALCAIGIAATIGIAVNRSMQRPDWPAVARVLGTEPPPGQQRAILIQHYRTLLPLSLYLPRLTVLRSGARVSQVDVISMVSPRQPLCWWGAACNLMASQMQRDYPIPGLRAASERHVYQFTIRQLVARRPIRLTPAMVARALSTTTLHRDILLVQRAR